MFLYIDLILNFLEDKMASTIQSTGSTVEHAATILNGSITSTTDYVTALGMGLQLDETTGVLSRVSLVAIKNDLNKNLARVPFTSTEIIAATDDVSVAACVGSLETKYQTDGTDIITEMELAVNGSGTTGSVIGVHIAAVRQTLTG